MNEPLNLFAILQSLWNRKWLLIAATVVTGALASILALQLDDKFESATVFFPANPLASERINLFKSDDNDAEIYPFGSRQDADRLISLARSGPLANKMITDFKLAEVYEISPDTKDYEFKVQKQFQKHFKASKNEFNALNISFLDKDPQLAADIANAASAEVNKMASDILSISRKETADVFQLQYDQKLAAIEKLNKQSLTLSDTDAKKIQSSLKEKEIENLSRLATLVLQYNTVANQNINAIYTVEKAYPSNVKASPFRSLIVIGSVLLVLTLLSLAILFLDGLKRYRTQLNK